jgi:hypothetical protein
MAPTLATVTPAAEVDSASSWDEARWLRILDRIEHRDTEVGLRFWGPPLWLEVTMTGPDSASWAVAAATALPQQSWDWQSGTVGEEAMRLVEGDADDVALLAAASRYTFENLVLNATHETGEWLRLDGRRLYPPHGGSPQAFGSPWQAAGDGRQGNGQVVVQVQFDAPAKARVPAEGMACPVANRAAEVIASWRFTFLPGTSIAYGDMGPHLVDERPGAPDSYQGTWSAATRRALNGPSDAFSATLQEDVHRMVIRAEVERICHAFHVDGRQAWYLESETSPTPRRSHDDFGSTGKQVTVQVTYSPHEATRRP